LPGEREIREASEVLRKAELRNVEILPLYARLSVPEQQKIFSPNRSSRRRIIISSNVAETSVTVPGINYVIDSGVARISRYSYRSKVQRLPVESISQASANQRAGRCGRIAAGICIRLYSEDDFESRAEFTDAEIRRTNLAAVILQMLNLKLGDIARFPFIDPPDNRFINDGFKLLEELSAVTKRREMTSLGRKLAKLPVDPRIGRMIIEANQQGSLQEVLIIASALSVQDPKERPLNKQQAADLAHKEYQDESSDFISFVNLWNVYEQNRQELSSNQLRKFCTKNYLSFMRMREWRDVHRQLHIACKSLGYKAQSSEASYQSVHVALLSGLLGHIGFKQENKEFLGARNRRFYIFPASVQYKKPAKWLMVSELVETSRLYGRVAAKIEPEWVEPLAKHLVKKSYSEPRWQKKRAQVSAYEQVVLYGLTIIQKRVVNFGAIEPEQSQDIFIRSALVEGDYQTSAAFYKHNQQMLDKVESLEAKSRRRDLLIDEEALYDFYVSKVNAMSERPLVNGAAFEKWRKQLEKQQPKILFLQESDVLQRSSEHINDYDYPNIIEFKGIELKLSYHFSPSSVDDGVSIHLPVALLKQFPKERLDWLVPGLIKERCIALLKSLPKARRKHFVPIPDYVNAFMESMHFAQGDLLEQISHQLLRMSGVKLEIKEFSDEGLAAHLQFNVKLIDNDAKLIEQSRDIERLRDTYSELVDSNLLTDRQDVWGETGLDNWSFDELPQSVQIKQGGIKVTAWPALKRNADKVDLILTMNEGYSNRLSKLAISYFASKLISAHTKKARSSIPKLTEIVLFSGKKFNKKIIESELDSFVVRELLRLDQELPRTKQAFLQQAELIVKENKYQWWMNRIAGAVFTLHKQYHQLQKQLQGQQQLATITIISDIKQQLERLFTKDYLSLISWYRIEQYTRYMKSIEVRLEKYQRELPRQKMLTAQINEMEKRLDERLKILNERNEVNPELENYRWMIEEYRISLFSQQIKTTQSVSEKRMQQNWREISN
jgi:ATP-dependent helicase HrpA